MGVAEGDNAEGFLDGGAEDHVATSILRVDCSVSRFARAWKLDGETAKARELAMGKSMSTLNVSRNSLTIL